MADPKKDMEYIWERIPKQKGDKTICYLKGDLAYLYHNGFVDTVNYKIEQWEAAFIPFQQKDGSYVLNKEEFLTLRKYRYNAKVYAPFDAFKIELGPWSDKALEGLYKFTISKATLIPHDAYWKAINLIKNGERI